MKCDVVKSLVLPQEEWDLLDRVVAQTNVPSRNELIRRCVHHGLLNLMFAGLCPVAADSILKEARGHLLVPANLRGLLAGR